MPTWFLFLGLLVVKGCLLVVFGPIFQPDSQGYVAAAKVIGSGDQWLRDAGLRDAALPVTAFRMMGYPALIAGARLLAGEAWPWLLTSWQLILSLVASVAVYRLSLAVGIGKRGAAFAVLAHASTLPLVLDLAVLADSLNASLWTITGCLLGIAALEPGRRGAWWFLGLGLLLAGSFLLKEAASVLWIGLVPVALLAAAGPQRSRVTLRMLLPMLLLFAPLLLAGAAYKSWNYARSGTAFVTTGGQTAVLYTAVMAARHETRIFAGDAPLNEVARRTVRDNSFAEVLTINQTLFSEYGLTGADISALAYAKYWQGWLHHPLAMAGVVLGHFRANQALLPFRPIDSIREAVLWATNQNIPIGRWKAVQSVGTLLLFFAEMLSRAIAIVLFVAFLLGTLRQVAKERPLTDATWLASAYWLLYVTYFGAYSAVHLETRYLAPVIPFVIVLGVMNLQRLQGVMRRWKPRLRSQASGG